MRHNHFYLMFLILLIAPFVQGALLQTNQWPENSGSDGYYWMGDGRFNTGLLDASQSLRALTQAQGGIIAEDLNGDDTIEIVVLDDGTIKIFSGDNLAPNKTLSTGFKGNFSNIIAFDVDGDSNKEILVAQEQGRNVVIMEFNGTDLFLQNQFQLNTTTTGVGSGSVTIGCGAVDDCAAMVTENQAAGANSIELITFTRNNGSAKVVIDTATAAFCHSNNRHIAYGDLDNIGDPEFVASYGRNLVGQSVSERQLAIVVFNKNGSDTFGSPEVQKSTTIDGVFHTLGAGETCYQEDIGKYFSSPTMANVNNDDPGDDKEILVAYSKCDSGCNDDLADNAGMKIRVLNANLAELDLFPPDFIVDTCRGSMVSNVALGNFHPGTGEGTDNGCNSLSGKCDFCTFGMVDNDAQFGSDQRGRVTALCATLQNNIYGFDWYCYEEDDDFEDLGGDHLDSWLSYNMIGSAQHSQRTHGGDSRLVGIDLDEIITPYGVFHIVFGNSVSNIITNDIERIYSAPQQNASVVMIDAENQGFADMLLLKQGQIYYLDDNFENRKPQITNLTIRPCLDSTWKINTTPEIIVQVTDPDSSITSEQIFANVTIYLADANEQNQSTGVFDSGTFFSFTNFKANKTINSGTLRIEGHSTLNPGDPDVISRSFSVQNNGVGVDDCETTFENPIDPADAEVPTVTLADGTNVENNSISASLDDLQAMTGLGGTFWWLIIMAGAALAVWTATKVHGAHTVLGVAMVEVILLIVGAFLGFIPFGVIILLGVGVFIIFAVILGRYVTGTGS